MGLKGSHQAEQNHSDNHAYLGKGDNLTIEAQMKAHISRQQDRIKQRSECVSKLILSGNHYKGGNNIGPMKVADISARKCLTYWAWKHLWTPELNSTKYIRHQKQPDGSYHFWSNKMKEEECDNVHVVMEGTRCNCL